MGVVVHTGVGTLLAEEAKQNCFVASAAKELDKQQSANAASPRRKKHKPKDVTTKPAASAQPAATANENATCKRLLYEEIANSQVFDLLLSKPITGAANAAVADQVPEDWKLNRGAVLVATLPDVDKTPAGEAFDGAIGALVSGMESLGYLRDHKRLQEFGAKGKAGELYAQHCPGILLFRSLPKCVDEPKCRAPRALAVLTIGEN